MQVGRLLEELTKTPGAVDIDTQNVRPNPTCRQQKGTEKIAVTVEPGIGTPRIKPVHFEKPEGKK